MFDWVRPSNSIEHRLWEKELISRTYIQGQLASFETELHVASSFLSNRTQKYGCGADVGSKLSRLKSKIAVLDQGYMDAFTVKFKGKFIDDVDKCVSSWVISWVNV